MLLEKWGQRLKKGLLVRIAGSARARHILWSLLFFALGAAIGIGTAIIQVVPLVGALVGLLVLCLSPILWFMAVIALLYYGYQAYQGKRFAIPGLTSILRDQGWLS